MGSVKLVLNEYLDVRGISRYALAEQTRVRYKTIDKYYKNNILRYDRLVLAKICDALDCELSDIIRYSK